MSAISSIDDRRGGKQTANHLVDELLKQAGNDEKIFTPKLFVQFTGSLSAAAMLNQLLFWHDKGQLADNWVFKSDEHWSKELCISKHAVSQARNILKRMGLIKTRISRAPSGSPMHHYQCDLAQVRKLWALFLDDPATWEETARERARVTAAA